MNGNYKSGVQTLKLNGMIQGETWQSNLAIWFVGVMAGGINYSMELAMTPDWLKFFHSTLSAAFFGVIAIIAKQLYLFCYRHFIKPYSNTMWVIIIKRFKKEHKEEKKDDDNGKGTTL
jgi:hypothetical protein